MLLFAVRPPSGGLGQPALLRLSPFNQRTTPEVEGIVSRISADISTDKQTGMSYYLIRASINLDDVAGLSDKPLAPGMPVEVFVKTGDRRALSYLVKPLTDQMTRAFRED